MFPIVVGFAALRGIDPRCVFVSASPRVIHDDEALGGRLFIADLDDDAAVVGFELSEWSSILPRVAAADAGALAAVAETTERGGITTVRAIRLHRADGWSTCWSTNMLVDRDNVAVQSVMAARDGHNPRRRLPMPSGARRDRRS